MILVKKTGPKISDESAYVVLSKKSNGKILRRVPVRITDNGFAFIGPEDILSLVNEVITQWCYHSFITDPRDIKVTFVKEITHLYTETWEL